MPVIIDQLELVDTQPPAPAEAATPAVPSPVRIATDQIAAAWRTVARRAARVRAD